MCSSDFLANKPKGEIVLQNIEQFKLPNNYQEMLTIKANVDDIDDNLKEINNKIDSISFTKKYPESEELFSIISLYKKDINDMVTNITERKKQFIDTIEKYNSNNLKKRNLYITSLADIVDDINTKENNQIKIYEDKLTNLMNYYKGIYKINKVIVNNKQKIDKLYSDLFENDISKNIKMENGEEIVVTTNIVKEKEYDEVLSEQFKQFNSFNELITKIIICSSDINEVKALFNGTKYKSITNINQYIEKLYKNIQEFFDSFLDIKLKIEYKGKDLSKYSPGKRSEILLEIFLQGSSIDNEEYKYIILDQPEDNLDTNTITEKLVNKIRKLKINKQLFIISHSAPIIVNGDSDLVIYSEEKDNNISYQSGRINNKIIRNHIVNVLDGGEKNLRMRLNKYDFNYEEEL